MTDSRAIEFNKLNKGQPARLLSFGDMTKSFRARLYGLGLYPGVVLTLQHVAPLGCPVAIQVGSTLISVRRAEVKSLQLELI